jgi:hypothetical protein
MREASVVFEQGFETNTRARRKRLYRYLIENNAENVPEQYARVRERLLGISRTA